MNLTDFETYVASRIQDPANKLAVADRDDAIAQAVRQRYSKDRARELVSDVAGNGTALLALPTGTSTPPEQWEEGFSEVRSIEFPIGDIPPTLLENYQWQMYRTPTGLKIMLADLRPAATDSLRVTWTVRHVPGNTVVGQGAIATTVPDADFEAVSDLAASMCCEKLAAIYARTNDSTIQADAVSYRTKSQEYLTLAKALRRRYFDHVGIEEGDNGGSGPTAAAIAIGDMDLRQGSGVDRLTHRRPR